MVRKCDFENFKSCASAISPHRQPCYNKNLLSLCWMKSGNSKAVAMNRLGLHISTTLSESSASVYQKVFDTRKRRVCVMHCCKLGIFLMRVNKIGLRCRVYFGKLLKRYSTTLVLVAYFGRALSSVVEHYLHTVGVAGSKPAARTIPQLSTGCATRCRKCFNRAL